MLRRKLLIRVGLLICAFVVGAAVAVWLLQDVLSETDHVNQDAVLLMDSGQDIGAAITTVAAVRASGRGDMVALTELQEAETRIHDAVQHLRAHPALQVQQSPEQAALNRLDGLLPAFEGHPLGTPALAAAPPPGQEVIVSTYRAVLDLTRALRQHVAEEQTSAGRYFRAMVIGLTLAALVMVNVAILVLLRISQMVLKPVGALVEGSRELAAEHFDHRVDVLQDDEFGELAHAYNRLAEQLQANEERKAETLRQLAVTLNHDLNNAMSIIELQLGLMDRQAGANPAVARHLQEIRGSLGQMAKTVASLKQIRRVVLTEYGPGQKMLDLERSVEEAPQHELVPARAGRP